MSSDPIEHAAAELPEGYRVTIGVEEGWADITLQGPACEYVPIPPQDGQECGEWIRDVVNAAQRHAAESTESER